MTGQHGKISEVLEGSGSLVLKVPLKSDSVRRFAVLGNQNETFQLQDLPGAEGKHFVKESSADRTYLKTTAGKYVTFDKKQNRVIEDSRPGLEVTGWCIFHGAI